jgi:transcriptional regulator with XRE-family HTH domain
LSGLAGLARGHARQIEQDSPGRIAVATLAALASVFDVTIDWLYLGRGPRPSDRRVRAAVLSARVAKAPKQGRG